MPEDDTGKIAASAINTILNLIPDNNCLAFGPGVGVAQGVSSVLQRLLEQKGLKLVIDADGTE
jgi:NAD(P)H-hydrate repair Nnr-like enzyme with NAD(P)H-hydrate dehydratase domain